MGCERILKRTIANRLAGRRLTLEEMKEAAEVPAMLSGLQARIKLTVKHFPFNRNSPYDVPPEDAAEFVKTQYKNQLPAFLFAAVHEVYSCAKDERHYLDIHLKPVRPGERPLATLEYTIAK